jgi:hypothetical protein
VHTAVWIEIEELRRATLGDLRAKHREVFQEETRSRNREHLLRRIAWRLQALAEGDLTERARQRAQQIARDADLRMIAPSDFFTLDGERIETTHGNRNRQPDHLCSAINRFAVESTSCQQMNNVVTPRLGRRYIGKPPNP